jgi:peptidoglycan/xylan/chitin deacetylase (PgdA/CDA1 family)
MNDSLDRLDLWHVPQIFMYHGVADVPEDPNNLCVTPERFAEQMAWLKRRRLRGVSVAELVDAMRAGTHRGLVGLTFDDGYLNVLEAALPVLRDNGFTATMYIISDMIGRTNEWDKGPVWPLMTTEQIGEVAAAGMEIGSHSATHPRLAGLTADRVEAEIAGSRARLADLFGPTIRGFAYPYGSMDEAARAAVRSAGYDYACAVECPMGHLGRMALPRMYAGQGDDARRMAVKRLGFRVYTAIKGR